MMKKRMSAAAPPKELNPSVPEDLNALCVDLLRRDPADRPSGEEVIRRLGGTGSTSLSVAAARSRLFVGRAGQIAQLGESFTAVSRGRTSAVFVHGRSGAGKSTLLQRFLEGLVERGDAVVLGGRCYEQESVAYKAIDTLIDSLTRFLRRLHRHEAEGLMPRDVTALCASSPCCGASTPSRRRPIARRRFTTRRSCAAAPSGAARTPRADRRPQAAGPGDRRPAMGRRR